MSQKEREEWKLYYNRPVVVVDGIPLNKFHIELLIRMGSLHEFGCLISEGTPKENPRLLLRSEGLIVGKYTHGKYGSDEYGGMWYKLTDKGKAVAEQLMVLNQVVGIQGMEGEPGDG